VNVYKELKHDNLLMWPLSLCYACGQLKHSHMTLFVSRSVLWTYLASLKAKYVHSIRTAHKLCQDKHQDMRQKAQSCFIRDSDSSPHTEVARVCVLSHLL
jgi:hypothetical protein